MPLNLVEKGKIYTIKKVLGEERTRHYLEKLGFVAGTEIIVLSEFGGNYVILVKGTRIAIAKEMAKRIMV